VRKLPNIRIFKKIVRKLSRENEVKSIIVYGSFARGDYGPKSDIDLFIIIDNEEKKKELQDRIIELETEIGKSIQPTIRTKKEMRQTDFGLLQNVFREGKILYLKESLDISSSLLLREKPYIIYTFNLRELKQNEKARFNRVLYVRKKGKYSYKGLLEKIGGKKLTSGCVIIPYTKKENMEKLLNKFNIKYEAIKVWR